MRLGPTWIERIIATFNRSAPKILPVFVSAAQRGEPIAADNPRALCARFRISAPTWRKYRRALFDLIAAFNDELGRFVRWRARKLFSSEAAGNARFRPARATGENPPKDSPPDETPSSGSQAVASDSESEAARAKVQNPSSDPRARCARLAADAPPAPAIVETSPTAAILAAISTTELREEWRRRCREDWRKAVRHQQWQAKVGRYVAARCPALLPRFWEAQATPDDRAANRFIDQLDRRRRREGWNDKRPAPAKHSGAQPQYSAGGTTVNRRAGCDERQQQRSGGAMPLSAISSTNIEPAPSSSSWRRHAPLPDIGAAGWYHGGGR